MPAVKGFKKSRQEEHFFLKETMYADVFKKLSIFVQSGNRFI